MSGRAVALVDSITNTKPRLGYGADWGDAAAGTISERESTAAPVGMARPSRGGTRDDASRQPFRPRS